MHAEARVREMLLSAAKAEFLEHGYRKASLRSIAQAAEVSTGSVYYFFGSKEALFHAVVDDAAAALRAQLIRGAQQEYAGEASGEENDSAFILCLHRYAQEAVILLERAADSPMAHFREDLIALLEGSFLQFFARAGGQEADAPLIHLVVEQRGHAILRLIDRRYDLETTLRYAVLLGAYGEAGFTGMMQQYHRMQKGSAG